MPLNPYDIPESVPLPPGMSRGTEFVSGQYDATDNFFRSVIKDTWVGQAYLSNRVMAEVIQDMGPIHDDPDYNPMTDQMNDNYFQFSEIIDSKSAAESAYLRKMIDENQMLSLELDVGGAGPSRFLSQLVDPLTYSPVPIVKGMGFVKGMVKSAPAVGASVAASEYLRQAYDPTVTKEEMAFSVTAGTLMGGAIGGLAGSVGRKGRHGSNKSAGEVYDDLFNQSERKVNEAVVADEATVLTKAAQFFDEQGIKFEVTNIGGKLAGTAPDGSRVSIDTKAIRDDYENGMQYVLGMVESKTSKQKKKVFETVDVAKMKDWFDAHGGADKYIEFIIEHEKAHIKLGHIDGYPKDLMDDLAINMEREANEVAFREIGLEPLSVRKLEVPDNLKADLDAAETRLSQREAEVIQLREKAKDFRKQAKEKRDKADAHHNKSTQTQWRNEADRLDAQAKIMEDRVPGTEEYMRGMRDDVDSVKTRILELNEINDFTLYELKATGIGLEKIQTEQLPWYRLINTKLKDLAPDLAADWMRMAHKIAGSPGLVTKGAVLGQAVPVSVEMLSKQWHQRYRVAMEENNKIYMRYLEKAQDPTRMQATLERGKQVLGGPFGMAQPPEGKMSALEFRQAVSSSLMNNDEAADPFIAEAVAVWRPIFDKFEQAGKETGVFRTIEKARADVQKHEMNLETAKQEEITKIEGQLESARSSLEALERSDLTTDKFFHRMIRQDKLEDPVLRERLEGVLRAHFMDKPYHYVNGKRMDFSTHPDHVEARVRETIAEMYREASFNDSLGLIDKGNKLERYENRIKTLQEDLKTASNKEKGILEHQIQIIQNKIDKGVGHGKGGPSPVLTRKLDIPTKDIAFILEDDVEMVMQHYVLKMAPVVEMARKFGDFRIDGEISRLTQKIDEVIAANPEKADALTKEKEVLVQAAEDLRDKVLGVYGIPNNPDALHNRAIRSLKAYNVLTLMGKAWMAALADSGKVVMSEGFTNTFGGLIKSASERLEKGRNSEWFMSGKEVEMAGEALDIAMATRMNQMSEMGGSYHGMTKLERWFQQQQGPFFFVNLLSAWTDNIKRFSGSLIQSRMIEDAVLWSEGKLPAERIERLAAIGMSEQWAKRFTRQWKEAGSQKGEHLFLANTTEWTDQEAVTFFRAMLATEVDNAVITPGAADKFNFMGKPFGSMLMQYRGFGLSATQRILMSGLQKKDMSTLAGAVSMISIAFMVDYARRPDYAEMDMKDMVFRAVERSGIAGIFSDINGALEVASGGQLGLRPMMGIQQIVSDPNWAQRTGAVAGPVTNQWLQLVHAVSDPSATENEQARAIRYMIPYNNLWFWSDTFTRAQRTLQEQLEE